MKEVDNPYYASVIAGARAYVNECGYALLAASSEGDYDAEQQIVDVFKSKDVDGLIVVPVMDSQTDLSYLFDLKRRNFLLCVAGSHSRRAGQPRGRRQRGGRAMAGTRMRSPPCAVTRGKPFSWPPFSWPFL